MVYNPWSEPWILLVPGGGGDYESQYWDSQGNLKAGYAQDTKQYSLDIEFLRCDDDTTVM